MQIASADNFTRPQGYDHAEEISNRKEPPEVNFFDYLPDELLLNFTKYFTVKELGLFKATCKRFHQIASDASLIPTVFRTRFPVLASFHKKQEMTEALYQKAIFRQNRIFDRNFFPKETVFCKNFTREEGINALACRDNTLYSSFFSKNGVMAWDLNEETIQNFECRGIVHCLDASKDYFFYHGDKNELISYKLSDKKKTVSRHYAKADFWHFKVINEAVYARAEYGAIAVNPETGKHTKYPGDPSIPFYADENQILGINYKSIIAWDSETKKVKSELPLNSQKQGPAFNFFLQNRAYFSEGQRIFLAADNACLLSYDLREGKMNQPLKIHESLIYGIIFYNNELVTSSADQTLKIWDIRNLNPSNITPIRSIRHNSDVTSLCCDKDSLFIGTRAGDIVKYDFFQTEDSIEVT